MKDRPHRHSLVPAWILTHLSLRDISQPSDTRPRFRLYNNSRGSDLHMWVDEPDQGDRLIPQGDRFIVTRYDSDGLFVDVLFSTSSEEELKKFIDLIL